MFFVLIFLPKAISFHIWRLKCICIFLFFTKSMGQACAFFFGFYGFAKSDLYEMAFNRLLAKWHTLKWGGGHSRTAWLWSRNQLGFYSLSSYIYNSSSNFCYCDQNKTQCNVLLKVIYIHSGDLIFRLVLGKGIIILLLCIICRVWTPTPPPAPLELQMQNPN